MSYRQPDLPLSSPVPNVLSYALHLEERGLPPFLEYNKQLLSLLSTRHLMCMPLYCLPKDSRAKVRASSSLALMCKSFSSCVNRLPAEDVVLVITAPTFVGGITLDYMRYWGHDPRPVLLTYVYLPPI